MSFGTSPSPSPASRPPLIVAAPGGGPPTLSTPETASVAVKAIDTLVLFQPAAFAAGVRAPNAMLGAPPSILTVQVTLAVLPALSVAVRVIGVTPSAVTGGTVAGPTSMPDPVSDAETLTVTGPVLFQPSALAAGDCEHARLGGVLSSRIVIGGGGVSRLPALFVAK